MKLRNALNKYDLLVHLVNARGIPVVYSLSEACLVFESSLGRYNIITFWCPNRTDPCEDADGMHHVDRLDSEEVDRDSRKGGKLCAGPRVTFHFTP